MTFPPKQIQTINTILREAIAGGYEPQVYVSDYTTAAFIGYEIIESDDYGAIRKKHWERVTFEGERDKNPLVNLKFDNLSDRVHFYNSLYPVKYE